MINNITDLAIISQHNRLMSYKTIIPIVIISLLLVTCLIGVGFVVYMLVAGHAMKLSDAIFIIAGGCLVGIFLGIMVQRFCRRLLSVRKVLLFEDDRIAVVSWRKRMFVAKLPENIIHMLFIGSELTVTLRIEGRVFIVDSDQFSNKEQINTFLQRFLDRYRVDSAVH